MTISGENYRALVRGQLHGLWPTCLRGAMRAASVPYGWTTRVRNWLYDRGWKESKRVTVPVISVGNLTLGGTGKTPCVEYVARLCRQRDRRVAILSRGYGAGQGRNDEALVLEENLPDVPHLQGTNRAALAAIAIEELESEVLILDDGFQHRRLARDLDVVLVDATDPWGEGFLFPRGLLREAPTSLRRAGLVVLTRCDQVDAAAHRKTRDRVARLAPQVPVVETTHRPADLLNAEHATASLDRLRERPVAAFCGIGNAEAFRRSLIDLGAEVRAFRTFPDHHPYSRQDVMDLRGWSGEQLAECLLVTTQKDIVKIRLTHLGGKELWALRISLHIEEGQEALDHELERVLAGA